MRLRSTRFPKLFFGGIYRVFTFFPKYIWHAGAICGILVIGLILGVIFMNADSEKAKLYDDEVKKNERLIKLIDSYEDLSKLYYSQGQNVGVVLDMNVLRNYPDQYEESAASLEDYRNRILVQQGRILELRKNAGLSEDKSSSSQ